MLSSSWKFYLVIAVELQLIFCRNNWHSLILLLKLSLTSAMWIIFNFYYLICGWGAWYHDSRQPSSIWWKKCQKHWKSSKYSFAVHPRNSRALPYRYCQDDGVEHCHHIPASEHPSKQGLFDPRPIYRTVHIRWCFVLFGTDCKKKVRISARFVHLFWNGFGMKRRRRLISLSVKGSSGYVSRKQKEHKASASQRN